MKILIIEDNPDIEEVLDYILKDEGHEVIQASDALLLNQLDSLQPDLILMDEILVNLRGSVLIKGLKADPETHHIPVILISAMPNLRDIAEECGADAYLEKPFDITTITDLVENFILKPL